IGVLSRVQIMAELNDCNCTARLAGIVADGRSEVVVRGAWPDVKRLEAELQKDKYFQSVELLSGEQQSSNAAYQLLLRRAGRPGVTDTRTGPNRPFRPCFARLWVPR